MATRNIGYKKLRDGLEECGVSADDAVYAGSEELPEKFTAVTGRRRLPGPTFECVCGHYIKNHHYVYDPVTNKVATVGCVCIENFMDDVWEELRELRVRRCPECGERNRARSKHCADCRGPRMPYGKHAGRYFRELYEEEPGLIWFCKYKAKFGAYVEFRDYVAELDAEE